MLQTLELRQIWLSSEKVKHLFGFQAKAEIERTRSRLMKSTVYRSLKKAEVPAFDMMAFSIFT